jgi:hypothetical protein
MALQSVIQGLLYSPIMSPIMYLMPAPTEPAPDVLEADITVILKSGQSDSLGQDALPMPARTPSDFAQMLDTNKPPVYSGSFGTTLTQAVGNEYIFGTTNHQGDTFALAIADNLEKFIETIDGVTQAEHGKQVIVVDIGLSSAPVSSFSYGTAHFTKFMDWCDALVIAAAAANKTVKVKALIWAWGAQAYAADLGYASAYASINGYCGPGGDIDTHIMPKFGQTGETIQVGIMSTHHHYQTTNPADPFVARAEIALVSDYPDRYSIIQGKGIHHLNGLNRGWAGSSTHHHPDEEQMMGAVAAWWLHTKLAAGGSGTWFNAIPTIEKTGARQFTLTLPGFPADAYIGFKSSGLFPTIAQPMHGWWVCDQSTPTVSVPLVRPPYPGNTAGTIIIDTTADIPANWEVRYGCTASSYLAGNTVIKFNTPYTAKVRGVDTPLFRAMPALRLQGT